MPFLRSIFCLTATLYYSSKTVLYYLLFKSNPDFNKKVINGWSKNLCKFSGTEIEIKGEVDCSQNFLVVSNHLSNMDIPILMKAFPDPLFFLAKIELYSIPIFGKAMEKLGFIFVHRKNPRKAIASMKLLGEQARSGKKILIFVEGTRSKTGEMLPFKKGGFLTSQAENLPVLPVAISGSQKIVSSGSLVPYPGKVTVSFGNLVYPPESRKGIPEYMDQVRKNIEEMLTV